MRLRADDFFTDRRDTWRLLSNIGGEPYIELERNPGRPERACSGLYLPWPAGDQRDLSVALNA